MTIITVLSAASTSQDWRRRVAHCSLPLLFAGGLAALDSAWVEGESPVVPLPAAVGAEIKGWGNEQFMSGGKVLNLHIPEGETTAKLGAAGATVAYDLTVKEAGKRSVWARIGYEGARSPFDWRIGDGAWTTVKPDELTRDLMEIATWNEIAWLKMGEVELKGGTHRLQFRHKPATREDNGKQVPVRTLWFLDAACVAPLDWEPLAANRPGTDHRNAADLAAEKQVFSLPASTKAGERSELALTGNWSVARWDENGGVAEATRLTLPESLPDLARMPWTAIAVPGGVAEVRPDLSFCHRLLYRTRVEVPKDLAGRSFQLRLQNFGMIAAVFVNGQRTGFSKDFGTVWTCDLTPAVKAGAVNDLVVAFKDRYYALRGTDPMGPRRLFNLPSGFLQNNQGVTWTMDMPAASVTEHRCGLIEEVRFIASGPVYASDVFAKPSVAKKSLGLETTLANPGDKPQAVEVVQAIRPWSKSGLGAPVKTFAAKQATIPAKGELRLDQDEAWTDATLWWPDQPALYVVETSTRIAGKPADITRTRFGFREWSWAGTMFKLNGVTWPLWADVQIHMGNLDKAVETYRATNQRMVRVWNFDNRPRQFNRFDEEGIPVRASGLFDGQVCAYGLVDNATRTVNAGLFENWRSQQRAQIRAERNHPSIMIWSIENEIAYINSVNFGWADLVEPELTKAANEVMALDPTRPVMVDGGRALKDQSLPVNGMHYNDLSDNHWRDYPDASYGASQEAWAKNRERNTWMLKPGVPQFHGETFYGAGHSPGEYAAIGGDACFLGPAETRAPSVLHARWLTEGYRWSGQVAAWHFWMGAPAAYTQVSFKEIAVLCREWTQTHAVGAPFGRTLKVFNDTRFADPITATWALEQDGKTIVSGTKDFALAPGTAQELPITLAAPKQPGTYTFVLTATRKGAEVFRDSRAIRVIAPEGAKVAVKAGALAVLDPSGLVGKRLTARGMPFTAVKDLAGIPASATTVIVGPDAVTEAQTADPAWVELAARGVHLLILDQRHSLRYQAIGADLEPTTFDGRIAFAEDLEHPALAGLDQDDLRWWSGGHVVYRSVYKKGSRGFRSLVQCDDQLGGTALAEVAAGAGVQILCQLAVGSKLDTDPVAQRLFDNLLAYAVNWKPLRKDTTIAVAPGTPFAKLVDGLGLKADRNADLFKAIANGKDRVVVADGSAANLKALAGAKTQFAAFTAAGGWLMLGNVQTGALADFNALVGVEHVMRPFQMEKVVLATPRDPLTAGLTLRDVVMDNGKDIFGWMSQKFPEEDCFGPVVDLTEVGSFLKLPTPEEMGKPAGSATPGWDHWPGNLVNGYTADDTWRLCYMIILDRGDKTSWTMELPKAEELTTFAIVPNVIYHKITKIRFYFDADPTPLEVAVQTKHERQDIDLGGRKAKKIRFEIADWEKSGRANVLGIDNLWLYAKRSPEWHAKVRPLLNIGGLVAYRLGNGGVLLNQLNIKESEANPVNAEKKATITKTLLANLGAQFSGSGLAAGARVISTPVVFPEGAFNLYTKADKTPGWWKVDGGADLSGLPAGDQTLGGYGFRLADFRTSPVPGAAAVQGVDSPVQNGSVEIPVKRTAAALTMLHAFHPSGNYRWEERSNRDRGQPWPKGQTVANYRVTWADGRNEEIPVIIGRGVGLWLDTKPTALAQASLAWTAKASNDQQIAVYAFRWDNTRPDVAIEKVALLPGEENGKWGTPVLFGMSTLDPAK
jgi:hypothetical protein